MMRIAKLAVLSLVVLVFVACEEMDGTLVVYSDLSIKNQHILSRTVAYSLGLHNVHLEFKDGRIEIESQGHKSVSLEIPEELLKHDGNIDLPASKTDQPFDTQAFLITEVQNTPSEMHIVYCTAGYYRIGKATYLISGHRTVMKHSQTTVRRLKVRFISPDTGVVLAELMAANKPMVETVVDQYLTECEGD